MLKRELKTNLKSLIIFSLIMIALLLGVAAIYPSIASNMEGIDEMMEMFPPELLKAFNMDVVSISTLSGWLLSEGYIFIQLLGGCFFAILGGTILLKETNDGTIEFLYSKPITKKQIIEEKMKCGIIYILIFNLLIAISTYIGLQINNDFNMKTWLLMTFLPILTCIFFFTISIFISLFLKKTNQSIGICIGSVFIFYFINMVANLSDKVELIKYFSIFFYTDSKDIIIDNALSPNKTMPICILILIINYISKLIYNRKELGL